MTDRSGRQHTLDDVVDHGRIAVCCGSGGVGKTTTAAILAIEGARRGRRAVVVTIDPAKRLANALGLDGLTNEPVLIASAQWDPSNDRIPGGALSAMMLDTKSTFDGLVTRYAESPAQSQRILTNNFYRNISGALSGTQEYMAMEKLHELYEDGGFDLIVVDTPPSRHALDFLDAPARLLRLLNNPIFRLLMVPTRTYLKVAGAAVQAFIRRVSRVVGAEVVDDIVTFFRAFEGMEEGFRTRAARVVEILKQNETRFVLVTSPRRDAIDEARFFAERIGDHDLAVDALVVNRVHPRFGTEAAATLRARGVVGQGPSEHLGAWLGFDVVQLGQATQGALHPFEGIAFGFGPMLAVRVLAEQPGQQLLPGTGVGRPSPGFTDLPHRRSEISDEIA